MTNADMIKWAGLDAASDSVWHASHEQLDRLIWIAQKRAKENVWRQVQNIAVQLADCEAFTSYPLICTIKEKERND